jgi:HPt (histidine-containing phosphotransfer) domain-containing protein
MNWDRLRELRDEVGEDAFAEVVEMFLSETDEKVAELHARASPETLAEDMHFLKGAALNLGLDPLAAACQTAETQAQGGAADAVDVPAILAIYAENRSALVAECARLAA